jgi:nucleoside-diphosphate-sugar epimerase
VGRQVLRSLLDRGCAVRVVVREGSQNRLLPLDVEADVVTTPDLFSENDAWFVQVCRNIDTIIHVAWNVEPGTYLQSPKNLDCLVGTLKLAKGAASTEVRRFVGIGTCFEYDFSGGMLNVSTPLRPLTPYAGAKAATFMALSQWLPSRHLEFAWCRLFYLYGDGEKEERFIPYLRARLATGEHAELTSGTQIRDYLDVQIAGELITDVALGSDQGPINICSGIPISIRELAEKVADEYGRRDLLKFGARADTLTDPPCILGVRKDTA